MLNVKIYCKTYPNDCMRLGQLRVTIMVAIRVGVCSYKKN